MTTVVTRLNPRFDYADYEFVVICTNERGQVEHRENLSINYVTQYMSPRMFADRYKTILERLLMRITDV